MLIDYDMLMLRAALFTPLRYADALRYAAICTLPLRLFDIAAAIRLLLLRPAMMPMLLRHMLPLHDADAAPRHTLMMMLRCATCQRQICLLMPCHDDTLC